MAKRYPDVKVTELIISKTGATECKSCTAPDPQTTDPMASDYCNPEEKFFAYDFLSAQSPSPVDVNSPNLWFKAGNCGSSMEIVDKSGISYAQFATTIFKPPTIDDATQIISQRTILATNITCDYPAEISDIDLDSGSVIQADGANQGEK